MPALKESSASLSAAMQLPFIVVSSPETEEATKVGGASRKSRKQMSAAPWKCPWKEGRGVAAIVQGELVRFAVLGMRNWLCCWDSVVHLGYEEEIIATATRK
jgi:hypothetical protein